MSDVVINNYYHRVRPDVGISFAGCKSRTQKQFADNCDINKMLEKYASTGIQFINNVQPAYEDVSEIGSFQDALERIERGKESFMQMDPKIRRKFGDNPVELFKFLDNPENRKEAIELGLIDAPVEPPKQLDLIEEMKKAFTLKPEQKQAS